MQLSDITGTVSVDMVVGVKCKSLDLNFFTVILFLTLSTLTTLSIIKKTISYPVRVVSGLSG